MLRCKMILLACRAVAIPSREDTLHRVATLSRVDTRCASFFIHCLSFTVYLMLVH
jgi:hypothetical protein